MKKTRIITATIGLCLAASFIAGCSTQETSGGQQAATRIEGGQTQISVEAGNNQAASGKYKFTYNGFDIVPGADAQPVIDALGEPIDEPYQGASCAGQGLDNIYEYTGFSVFTHEMNNYEYITGVVIENSLIDCGGVSVGDSIEKAKQVYGTPTTEDIFGVSYIDGNTQLDIITDGVDTIVNIRFRVVG